MDVVEHLSLCEKILNETLNDDNKHSVKSFEDKEGIFVLQVCSGEQDYTFRFHLISKDDVPELLAVDHNHGFYGNEDKDTLVEIKDIVVKGYVSVDCQEINISHLKSVLKCLARRYAKEINNNSFEETYSRSYFLSPNYDNFLEDLFTLVAEVENEDIDRQLLKEGIKTIIFTGEKALALNENVLYISGNIFQKRLFFKQIDDDILDCKILNIGPSTPLPLVYDILLVIFYFTDQEIRQRKFHELVKYFYVALEEALHEMDLDITNTLPLQKYEMHIRTFTPYVKLEMAHYYYHQLQKDREKYQKLLLSAILELNECILYPNLAKEDCYEIVRNKIGTSCYKFIRYKLIPIEERAGLMGDYFKVKIEICQEDIEEIIHLFAKYIPTANETMWEASFSIFKKEEFIYGTLIPEFIQAGLEDIIDFLPRCYFLRPNDVIILEDLSELNYKPIRSNEPLSYEILLMVIKKLAKLHACSLLYEEILSKESGETVRIDVRFSEYIEEKFFQKAEEKLEKLNRVGIATVIDNIMDKYPDIPKDLSMEGFKEKVALIFDSMFEKVRKSEKYRNVLCHGDIWTANILFALDSDQKPTNCCIIDYQLARYCPPAHDLLCLFYINTNQDTRRKYMLKLIDAYYSELLNIFASHNYDLNNIYSYDIFIESCEFMKPQSVCQAALYYQTSLCPDIIIPLLKDREKFDHYCLVDRTEVIREMMKRDSFRIRFKEIIEELYQISANK